MSGFVLVRNEASRPLSLTLASVLQSTVICQELTRRFATENDSLLHGSMQRYDAGSRVCGRPALSNILFGEICVHLVKPLRGVFDD